MTDVEMLPLPEWAPRDEVVADMSTSEVREEMTAYARANVSHATAAKDAEIERLRAERDTIVKEAAKYAERSGRVQAEVDRLRRMVQERDNMLGRRPCAGVNADGNPRCFELVDARAVIEALRAERDSFQRVGIREQERAERLAEALRRAEGLLRSAGIIAESDLERPHSIATEIKNALRDHDQEDKNDGQG